MIDHKLMSMQLTVYTEDVLDVNEFHAQVHVHVVITNVCTSCKQHVQVQNNRSDKTRTTGHANNLVGVELTNQNQSPT